MIKEGDIDAALSEAQQAVEQLAEATGATLAGQPETRSAERAPTGPAPTASAPAAIDLSSLPAALHRIFKVRVAVRVRLAERRMSVGDILQLSNGAILEFETPVQSPLKLLVNNKCVGTGEAVKVGENFGLRVSYIGDAAERIAMLGGAA